MKKTRMGMLAVLLIVLVSSTAIAQMGRGMGGQQGEGRTAGGQGPSQGLDKATAVPDFLAVDLSLTKEQISEINVLRETFLRDILPLREAVSAKRAILKDVRVGKLPDDDNVVALQNDIKGVRDQIDSRTLQYVDAVRKLLKPDQRVMLRPYWTVWDGGYIIYNR